MLIRIVRGIRMLMIMGILTMGGIPTITRIPMTMDILTTTGTRILMTATPIRMFPKAK